MCFNIGIFSTSNSALEKSTFDKEITMDLLPSIDELRDQLVAHDLAVRDIIALDQYIERQTEQTFLSNMAECDVPPFQRLIRIAVAEGIKRMYKEFRLQKWLKVQDMANTVRMVLEADSPEERPNNIQQIGNVIPLQQPHVIPSVSMEVQRQSWRPVNDMWQVSPIQSPLIRLLSPINTPHIETVMEPGQTQTLHSSPHIINRQLFPEGHCPDNDTVNGRELVPVGYLGNTSEDYRSSVHVMPEQVQEIHTPSLNSFQQNMPISTPDRYADRHHNVTQSEVVLIQDNQEHLPHNDQEHLNDTDEDMGWDSDFDSSYDDSEENLAGVLFATERLLPDEQAVRLDVEMGDMGVGHILFDRVSAAWYKYQCTFYRAS